MLEIRLLGQYETRRDGVPVEIQSRPAKTLLAYLLLTLGTHHPRERLAGLLWPNSSESNARKNLRQALWRLRTAIDQSHLVVDAVSVAFDSTSDFWLDIATLGDPVEQDLVRVVSLYEGELLPGFYEDWILLERDRLNAVFEHKMQSLLGQLLQEKRWTDALSRAEWWIAKGQIPEAAYRTLMVSHASMGELSKVEAAYQRCVNALQQEVGVDPSGETNDLYERLITGEALPSYTQKEGPARTEALRPRRPKLPAQPTQFIGRRQELAEARRLLAISRLLTFTGPGGIGKTRLALKVAGDVLDQYEDGVHFVNLASIHNPGYIIQKIADAIDFPLSTQEEPEDQLLGYLRNRQLLLVMDNFEHLLDEASVVSKILQAAYRVKVLATSREKLDLLGETTIGVTGLSFPKAAQSNDLLAHDALELFVQSARRVHPGIEPSARDLKIATQICQMVQGMPLAIELATAWLDTLSIAEIQAELRRGLDILSSGLRDVPERHRSIRATFDYSWSMINVTEREVFTRLSVFRGGFTRDSAQHIAGAALEVMAALVGKSFVRHDPDSGRFEIHELLRQYAQERLNESRRAKAATHEAHASYYARFMDRRWDHLRDGRQIKALSEIDADIENVRTAWRYSTSQNNAPQMRLFIHSIRLFYLVSGWNYAAVELFAEAVDALVLVPDNVDSEAVAALATAYQGFFMAWLGLAEQGLELAKQGSDILRRLNHPKDLAFALNGLALCAQYLDLNAEHEQASREMLQIATKTNDKWLEAFSLFPLSTAHIGQRDYIEARRLAKLSLGISEEIGDSIISLYNLSVLGAVAINLREYEEARGYYLRSLSASEKVGYRWAIENSSKYLGHVALAMNEIGEAQDYFRKSLRIAQEIGLGRDTINLLYEFARVRLAQDRKPRAVELLALILQHPARRQARFGEGKIQDSAQSLLDKLVEELTPDAYDAAMQRGKAMKLEDVVSALIDARRQ